MAGGRMKSDIIFKEYADGIISTHGKNSVFKIFSEKDGTFTGRVLKAERTKITAQRYGGREIKSISCDKIDAVSHIPKDEIIKMH